MPLPTGVGEAANQVFYIVRTLTTDGWVGLRLLLHADQRPEPVAKVAQGRVVAQPRERSMQLTGAQQDHAGLTLVDVDVERLAALLARLGRIPCA